jgi:hypothetical protein
MNPKLLALRALTEGCERCGAFGATRQPCRTSYADPKENVSPLLCAPCAEEYHDHWDSMWAEYYSGSGVMLVTKEQLAALRK